MNGFYGSYGLLLGGTFLLSLILTAVVRRFALRYGLLDAPGHRKVHTAPVPLMGGVAIVVSFYLVMVAYIAVQMMQDTSGRPWLEWQMFNAFGPGAERKILGILAGSLVIFVVGVVDDLKVLTPWKKLLGQVLAAFILAYSGIRLEAFVFSNPLLSGVVTMVWIVLLTNSLNFLDNMDGLCGGVSIIAALAFFLCVQADDHLVRVLLVVFAGAVGGFLYHNLNPARIFMGDAGAMFCGYLLGTVAVLGTYHVEGTPSHVAIAAPLIALSVPLFDTASVVYLRWRAGQNIMLGDKRHFSHRLVDLGMSTRHAVEFIYLAAGVVGLGAALLPRMDLGGTLIILLQTGGVFLLIVLLMNVRRGTGGPGGGS